MKKLLYIVFAIFLWSCNGEDVPDCFQNSGDIIQETVVVANFNKIVVLERVELIVKQDETQQVIIETGEYLLNDIRVRVENNTLIISNDNACNLTRDYGLTKVYVTSPELTEIRNSSGLTVRSDGVLSFESLKLVSEDFNSNFEGSTSGNFNVKVDCNEVRCTVNNLSSIFISGQTDQLFVGYYSGDARFEGRNLIAQDVEIFQRSSNDMIINPQESISGEIRGTGDVILVNQPANVDVTQFYTGQLILE